MEELMFEVFLYFFIAYFVIAVVIWYIVKHKCVDSIKGRSMLVAGLILVPLMPYICVNIQTALYGKILLAPTQKAIHEIDYGLSEIHSLKVLRKWMHNATVYVVVSDLNARPEYSGFTISL